jgi:hypothetical protein
MLAVRAILRAAPNVRRDLLAGDAADLIAACVDRDVARRPATAAEVAVLIDDLADATPETADGSPPAGSPFAPPAASSAPTMGRLTAEDR